MSKKSLKWTGIVFAVLFVIGTIGRLSGVETSQEIAGTEKESGTEEKAVQEVSIEEYQAYVANIMGSSFLKSTDVIDNYSVIQYYGSYEEYKAANPSSLITVDDYTMYFETGDTVTKILVSENVRILRQFPELEGVKMTLPYDSKTYYMEYTRADVNTYLGYDVASLSPDDGSWQSKFIDPIVYNKAERNKFFNEFGVIK